MPYGRSHSSGHGYRPTAYRWSPSFLPPARRRKHRYMTPSRNRNAVRGSGRKCFERMLNGMFSLLDLLEVMVKGPRSDRFISFLGNLIIAAVMVNSEVFLVLGLLDLALKLISKHDSYASNETIKDYNEKKKAIRISRKISVNPPPTPEAIRQAWAASRTSLAGKLLAGTLLSDLEPVVDQSYLRSEDGTIVGRRPGIKGWLQEHCPDMVCHYKALMSYKALADKLRKALGIEEPDTLAGVLDFSVALSDSDEKTSSTIDGTEETSDKSAHGAANKMPESRKIQPKSLRLLSDFKLLESNRECVFKMAHEILLANDGTKGPDTMSGLDAVLREKLELVWMRRVARASRIYSPLHGRSA